MESLEINDEVIVEWLGGAKRYKISSKIFDSCMGYKKVMVKDDKGNEQSAPIYLVVKL